MNSIHGRSTLFIMNLRVSTIFGSVTMSWESEREALSAFHRCTDPLAAAAGTSINDALRHAELMRIFTVDGLCRLAALSVDRSPDDVVSLEKLAEGGFNRTFRINMCDGFQMVPRIPYPVTKPKYFALASEVATMDFSGMTLPQVYGYAPAPDNAAETDHIRGIYTSLRVFNHATAAREGETCTLKVALIEATERWEALSCPVAFDAEDVRATLTLDKAEGWVGIEHYEEAKARRLQWKEDALARTDDEEVPFDDMDEAEYN
ncbi:hypothetical protein EUX98_g4698 [Antrodiella citrinella]|uniref:Uncharacterized protein n=1 Tax=Antrodiella citrinella TaxID=2447956 RepID=A0A4S4MW53_9APHY|nr:hypothetical protein EUX98_g4698 [Antrodiella citrinella]